ncbi:MAG: hypothetical protein KDK10_19030 [Maritimibacter sp.]|nr:hypothetical protein [Maritimibacter sp.]
MTRLNAHPLASALLASMLTGGGLVALDWHNSPRLVVATISPVEAPALDGDISDEAWHAARPVRVLTSHGGDFGGSGQSRITVRAVQDGSDLYMALEWEDPTRSLEFLPLVKDAGVWRALETGVATASEARFFDDRIAVMLANPGVALIGGGIHLGARPLEGGPASTTGRGLHYTGPGSFVDLWQWHAALGAVTTRVEDGYIGAPKPPSAAEMAGQARYLGGIGLDDPARPVAMSNVVPAPEDGARAVEPVYLPWAGTGTVADIRADEGLSDADEPGRVWAVRASAAKPHSPEVDARFADGSVVPGVFVDDSVDLGPQDVTARGAWAGGRWVLEIRRSLAPGEHDIAFADGTMLWFAAFDHSQTRHTYHLRPLIVEMR